MKKLKKAWRRIPRKARILILLLLLVFTAMVFYVCISSPTFGPIHMFRRAEKAQCVGPATILDTVELDGNNYDYVILAEDELGIYMYLYAEIDHRLHGNLHYREKTGDLTVIAVPQYASEFHVRKFHVPIVAFDDYPEAVRATLEVTITNNSTVTYHAEAQRETDGYFCFWIDQSGWEAQLDALRVLSATGDSRNGAGTHTPIPGIIRLYDEDGQLIREKSFFFRSLTMEANDAEKEGSP